MLSLLAVAVLAATSPLTLDQVLADVGERAPVVEVGKANVDVRRAAVLTAGTWDDAQLGVMAQAIPLPGGASDPANPTMIAYRIGQPLNLFNRRGIAREAAGAEEVRAMLGPQEEERDRSEADERDREGRTSSIGIGRMRGGHGDLSSEPECNARSKAVAERAMRSHSERERAVGRRIRGSGALQRNRRAPCASPTTSRVTEAVTHLARRW